MAFYMRNPTEMKILIISCLYTPSLTPRAFRWAAIAEHWAKEGHHVDVVCESAHTHAESEIINGVHVHRAGNSLFAVLRNKAGTHAKTGRLTGFDKFRGALAALAKKASRYLWRKLYWPDYACFWYWPAAGKAKALQAANDYDVMYSSSIPFTGHLVALGIKNKYPHLRWIVDIGDPFCFSDGVTVNNFALYERLNISYERKIFSLAEAISVTTGATRERYGEIFPFAASKISIIPPLLSVDLATETGAPRILQKDDKIRLVFLGTLYKTIRDPGNLLKLFSKLLESDMAERLELHFYGDMGSCPDCFVPYRDLLEKKIFLHGLVDRKSAAQAMKEADILINIGNDTAYQLPSKIVEYLATMKPVLNFAKTDQDSSTVFFRHYDGIMCIVADEAIGEKTRFQAAADFIRYPQKIDIDARKIQLDTFRIDQIAKAYARLQE